MAVVRQIFQDESMFRVPVLYRPGASARGIWEPRGPTNVGCCQLVLAFDPAAVANADRARARDPRRSECRPRFQKLDDGRLRAEGLIPTAVGPTRIRERHKQFHI